ncbi:hypothetical protein [uncultured Hyphomicrobium sp.]|uniref:hypothetical protein n=1 Tax=uncultured Hyphomicrobium sp. TaxID=194373 RepID=UPI0025FD78F9|nr:hypothetical protein [uncultured Hyphomicrobium sp.]
MPHRTTGRLNCRRRAKTMWWRAVAIFFLGFATPALAQNSTEPHAIESLLQSQDLTVLTDVKHGVRERIAFFSSPELFEAMKRAGVRHLAIEMPRVLGRQAMGIATEADVEAFAQDIIRSDRWHFLDPDNPGEEAATTQRRVATALGRQVLLSKKLGINPIFYDFNNPLGGFTTFNDPVYRCLAELDDVTWVRYGLDGKITKAERDAAIMRERFSHDDELAEFIENEVRAKGGGKLVVVPGYAHAAIPGGLSDRLEARLRTKAAVVAVFRDSQEDKAFHDFLWQQSRLLSINLSRPPHFYYSIADDTLRKDEAPGRYVALDGSVDRITPAVCFQLAHID